MPQDVFNQQSQQGLVLSKDVEVSSVTFYFSGLNTLYLDNLVVGPAGATLSSNANLSNLALSGTTLSPAFSANTVNYTASVANAVTSVTVTPTKADANATVSINGTVLTGGATSRAVNLNVGANTITVVVTAQNGSTKTYTVTITRAAAPSAPPVAGYVNALQFDGVNDYVEIPSQPSNQFNSETEFTVSLWFKANSMSRAGLFSRPSGGGGDMQFWLSAENGTFTYGIDKHGTGWTWLGTGTAYKLGEWVQVTTVRRNVGGERRMEIYANGVLIGSDRVNHASSASNASIRIGTVINADGGFANGQIDNVSLWKKALTAAEIKTLGATTLNGNEAGLAGYWRFDETSGNIAYDATSNANHGTLRNMDLANARVRSTAGDIITKKNVAYAGKLTGSDPEGKPLTYVMVMGSTKGTLVLNHNTGAFTYTPRTDAVGADNFSYKVSNGTTESNTATINVTIVELAAPSVPDLLSSSDTGISNSDNITNDNTPTFSGKAAPGYNVTLYSGTNALGTAQADASGNWTITTTSSLADGVHTITAKAVDGTGSQSPASAALTVVIDTTAPSTTITFILAAVTNATSATFHLISDETASTFQASVDGSAYTTVTTPLSITGLSEGTHTVQIRAMDAAGNLDPTPASYTWTVDATAPTVTSINRHNPASAATNASTVTFLVSFSEAVTGVDAADFTLTATGNAAGYVTGVSGAGNRYEITVSDISGSGILRLDMNAGGTGITDVVGNGLSGGYTTGQTYTIDITSPVITSVSVPANATYSAGQQLDFAVNFSEAVTVDTNNGTPALGLTIGAASRQAYYLSGSGTTALTFRYTVQPGEQDTDGITLAVGVTLNGGTITDAIGNAAVLSLNGVASTAGVLVDAVAPTITSITLPNDGVYNLDRERYLLFSVAFSENMQRTQGSYLELRVGTQIRKATLDWAYENSAYYAYAVQEGEQGTGLEVLALKSDATMPTDMQGNALSTGSTFPIVRSNVRVDGIRPLITGLTVPANKIYKQGEHLDFTVRFSEKVELREAGPIFGPLSARATSEPELELPEPPADGNPFIPLKIGEKVVLALYNQGSGTEQISFRYTVQEGELDMDGIEVAPMIVTIDNLIPGPRPMESSLPALGGFTITDLAGNHADNLEFGSVPSTTGVLVDAVAPSVATVTAPANGTYTQGDALNFMVQFTEPIVVTGSPLLQVLVGDQLKQAVYQSGSGTSTLAFRYTVGAGDQDTDGISFQQSAITLNGSTIADVAGNASKLSFGPVDMTGVLVDAVAPTLQTVRIASSNSNSTVAKVGDVIMLQFVASEAIQLPTVQIAGNAASVVATSGSEYRATYTMTSASSEGVVPFTINFSDLAGNAGTAVSGTTNGSSVTFDKTAPTGTIAINGGAPYTASPGVTLSMTATDALTGVEGMRFSNDNTTWSTWLPFATSQPWTLSAGNGNRKVYAQLRDGAGNIGMMETQIILDNVPLTLTLSSDVQASTNKPFEVFFTFSKAVTGFTNSDLTLVNAAASNLTTADSKVYKATITPASEGEVNVSVAAGVAVDAAGNLNAVSNTLSTLYDRTQPIVTLASIAPGLVRGPFEVTFTFSEQVAGFTLSDIAVTKGTASAFEQVGDKAYAALITPNQEGDVTVAVVPDAAQDAAGNSSVASLELKRTFDSTKPALVITTTASNPTNAPFDVTFTFSEEVSGFELADIAVANGTASNLIATDGRRYSARVTPAASGEVTVSVAAEKAQDAAGNLNTASNILKVHYDAEKPTVVLATSADGAVNAAFPVSLTFSKEMSSLAVGSIAVTNGTVSNLVKADARTYTALVTPVEEGRVEVSLPADAVQDAAGNGNQASNSLALVYDSTPPAVTLATTAPNPTNRGFEVSISFSEKVSGLALQGIAVTNGTLSGLTSTDNQNFTVQVSPSADGEVSFSIPAGMVQDAAGNGNLASTELARHYDATKPQVTVASTATSPVNAAFTAQFTFTEAVAGFDLTDITVSNGAASDFEKVSATAYTALITPASNGEVTVAVAAGKATDEAGNDNLASNVLKVSFDTAKPTLLLATAAPAAVNAPFNVSFTFSKAVTGFNVADINVTNGSATDFAVVDSRTFAVRVIPAADGEVTVSVPADAAMDAASNGNLPSNTLSLLYDAARPAAVLATTAPDPTNRAFQVSLTFTEPVSGFSLQSMAVANAALSGVTTTDNQHFTFEVTPLSDGLVSLLVPEGVVADAAGNRNTASERLTRTFNATRPALALTTNATSPTNTAFGVTFTFSKEVTGFELGDIDVSNGAAAAFTQVSAQVYTARITPDAEGEVILHVKENVAHDRAGNGNTEATALKLSIDKTQPTVVLASSAREKLNAAFEVSVVFSERVTGFVASDVTVVNGTVTGFSAEGDKAYTLQITPQADGEVRVALGAGVAHDAAGNSNLASEQLIRFYDSTRPAVEVATAVTSPVNAAFAVRFSFSEAVESFELTNITVKNGSVSNLTKESATLYTALVTPGANGEVAVAVGENQTQDAFGNGNLPSNQLQVSYDVSQPTLVLSATAADVVKAPFEVTFTFSKEVTGFALEDIVVTNGAASALKVVSQAIYTALVTPLADGEVSIAVAADVARDAAGNGNQAAGALTRTYDATRPTLVLSTETSSPTNTTFEVIFTFSESISGFSLENISVEGGVVSGLVPSIAGKVYKATITPSAEGGVAVSVAADVVQDKAGNGNLASNVLRMQHDKTRPTVILATTAPSLTNVAIPLTIEFSEPVTGFALAALQVSNGAAADLKKLSETKYSALVTPARDGEVSIAIAENKVVDAATNGNTASNQLNLTYDGTAPAGYTINWGVARVDVSNLDAITLLVTGAEPGTTYTYHITSGQESTVVSGTGEVTEESFRISNLDLDKLKDGQLTVKLYLTDEAGNKGAEVTAQVLKVTRNIASVTVPEMIQVPIRTTFEQVPLPSTVEVTYSTGETAQVKVQWEAGAYDGTKAGQYTLTGALEPAEMTTNLGNLTASIQVEVQPNKAPAALAFSATTFKPEATADQVIGTLSTTDPDDSEFVYTLASGEGDTHNALFEIRGDQVYLKSNKGLSGMTTFTIRVRSTDPYLNTIERSFTLTKQAYDRTVDQLKIVNAFSPNGDGINDNWTIPELRFYNEVHIQVFDRSGVRVFETRDPETGWNGRSTGGQVLKGPFLYIIEVRDINWVKRGVVTILSK
ncbi:Ig-like domain-containing protein [Pontibacter chinhatensis]|uniref:Ig-like domain-containing protein n=1 Tax=Pontibacter chinhatensis TaxID=1436961 RepID=UPI0015878894|nr:Ig-like domain-containing protein [Pontibacter chinhatensis]